MLRTVDFVNDLDGWVGGDQTILATTDGGQHWQHQYTGSAQIVGLDFVSPLDGWALATDRLLGTTDGGRTWQRLGEPSGLLRSIDFVGPSLGWGVAGGAELFAQSEPESPWPFVGGSLVQTTDGGRSWTAESPGMPVDSVCFSDMSTGWAAYGNAGALSGATALPGSAMPTVATPMMVQRTVDGGRTWTPVFTAPIVSGEQWLGLLKCSGASVLVLFSGQIFASNHHAYIMYHADDAGAIWTASMEERYMSSLFPGSLAPEGPGTYPGPFSLADRGTALSVGICPVCGSAGGVAVEETSDGGRSWGPRLPIPGLSPHGTIAVALGDAQHAWVVGGEPSLIRTTADGGRTWVSAYP